MLRDVYKEAWVRLGRCLLNLPSKEFLRIDEVIGMVDRCLLDASNEEVTKVSKRLQG